MTKNSPITHRDIRELSERIARLESHAETIARMDERTKGMKESLDNISGKFDDDVVLKSDYNEYKRNNDKKIDRIEKALIGFALFILAAVGTVVMNFFLRSGGS